MYRRKYQRKRGVKRALVMLLTLVMLVSVCLPAMQVSAEEVNGETASTEETFENTLTVQVTDTQAENDAQEGTEDLAADAAGDLDSQQTVLPETLLVQESQESSNYDALEGTAASENPEGEPTVSEAAKAYLDRIEELKGQLLNLDPDASDYEEQLDAIVGEIGTVVESAASDTALTEEEFATISDAADAVLDGQEELPEEKSDFANTAKIVNGRNSLTIHFVDEDGNPLNSTNQSFQVGNDWVDFATIAAQYPVAGYTYSRAYYRGWLGSKETLTNIKYNSNRTRWQVNNGNSSFDKDIYLEYKENTTSEPDSGKIRVYVYVAGKAWKNNIEFQDLIKLYACDANGYFPAGEIELDASYFTGKPYQTVGAPLITNDSDWEALLAALGQMDTSKLSGTNGVAWSGSGIMNYNQNNANLVENYLSQAVKAYNMSMGSQSTALFRWNDSTSYGFEDQTVKYHLDLAFNTKTITFVTGNNGITNPEAGDAVDGTKVDSRTYITGSIIQSPRELNVPTGYKVEGYYSDADFTTAWNGIGTPLNEDQTVYIKITLRNDIGTGAGTLKIQGEKFWNDDDNATRLRPDSIQVTLQGSASENGPWTNVATTTVQPDENGRWLYEFDVSNQTYTHYQVMEADLNNYTVEYDQPEVTFTYPSTGDWASIHPCNSLSFETYPKESTIVAAKKGNNYVVWTFYQLTSGEQELICKSLADSNWNTTPSNTTFLYGYGASTNGIIVTEESVQFSKPSDWSWFKIGTYNKATASATQSTITNTLATTDVTVTKTVSGNMGDQNKEFTFTYKVGESGTEGKFSLKHSQTKTLENLTIGETLYIKEVTDYVKTVTYTVTDGDETKSITAEEKDGWYQIPVAAGTVVNFNNTKNANIDTGVTTDSIPYVLLLTMAVIGAGALLLNKRRAF